MNTRDIILSASNYTDKIVFSKKGSVNISGLPDEYNGGFWVVKKLAVPHKMPRPLFIHFRFNFDGSSNWRTGGSSEVCLGYSDATNLVILINNITSGTLYYEMFGSWIDNYDDTNPLVTIEQPANDIIFDSRLNYRKIEKQGYFSMPDLTETLIPHGLTYTPSFETYFDGRPNEVWQSHSGGAQDPWAISNIGGSLDNDADVYVRTNATHLIAKGHGRDFGSDSIKVWYRIFADD